MLVVEQFLHDNYRFRRNQLSGKTEFAIISHQADGDATEEEPTLHFRPLTEEELNSIILYAKREEVCEKGNPKGDITLYVRSAEVPLFNPVTHFLEHLPQWDGQNHVAALFSRLPGLSTEQHAFLAVWLRSCVAHWLQMDTLHGNEVVPTLIGAQGIGKTTFLRRLLPQELREYYLDHLNLSNKFDKEMALTNNLLVNLDELEAIRPSQQSELKQTLSKNKVNGRPIFGTSQADRLRYASFTATTNNPHPLTDVTGSRRYLCLSIPKGQLIDNTGDIDYGQLYAQVVYELQELKVPYWYSNEEVARIQELNLNYLAQKDISEILEICFRKPKEGETARAISTEKMLQIMKAEYPTIEISLKTKVALGRALKALNYTRKDHHGTAFYQAIPLKAA
jgi:predicted P-loop ATPase